MSSYITAHISSQKLATQALIKFCEDHGHDVQGVNELRVCLQALLSNDIHNAVEAYLRGPMGGMGRFDDWLPPVVFDHENLDKSEHSSKPW
jgi:hypothetical protein